MPRLSREQFVDAPDVLELTYTHGHVAVGVVTELFVTYLDVCYKDSVLYPTCTNDLEVFFFILFVFITFHVNLASSPLA